MKNMPQFPHSKNLSSLLIFTCLVFSISVSRAEIRVQTPAFQLANIYYSEIDLQEYWVSEKLDGVRAYWNGSHFISKQGNI